MSIVVLNPLPTPTPAPFGAPELALPLPHNRARKRRTLDTTDGLVSVTAVAWGLTWRHLS